MITVKRHHNTVEGNKYLVLFQLGTPLRLGTLFCRGAAAAFRATSIAAGNWFPLKLDLFFARAP